MSAGGREPDADAGPAPEVERPPGAPQRSPKAGGTRASRAWAGLAMTAVLLVLLVIFIAENSRSVRISFLGADGHLALGLALLIAAVAGAAIALLVGSARILQLRRELRRHRRRE